MSIDHLPLETLGALVDGELLPHEAALAQTHLHECLQCSRSALGLTQMRSATKLAGLRELPPPEVLARLINTMGNPRSAAPRSIRVGRFLLPIAAMLALIAATFGAWRWARQSDSFAAEVLDQHLSTLTAASQPEILSSDKHTVKPWFEGKLPFSFNLPEPNALPSGTTLDGADLVYLRGKPTALLRFTMHRHHASVFVSQASPVPGLKSSTTRSGFALVQAKSAGLEYLGVSDVQASEVDALIRSLTSAQ